MGESFVCYFKGRYCIARIGWALFRTGPCAIDVIIIIITIIIIICIIIIVPMLLLLTETTLPHRRFVFKKNILLLFPLLLLLLIAETTLPHHDEQIQGWGMSLRLVLDHCLYPHHEACCCERVIETAPVVSLTVGPKESAVKAINNCMSGLYEADFWVPPDEAKRLGGLGLYFVRAYARLT